jgi:hypothetical protein
VIKDERARPRLNRRLEPLMGAQRNPLIVFQMPTARLCGNSVKLPISPE